jgi:hypothetical protein
MATNERTEYNDYPKTEIDIAKYLAKLEKAGMHQPFNAIYSCAYELADELRIALMTEEKLSVVNNATPLVQVYPDKKASSIEILMWAIAILSSSWTQWIFAAKSNNPDYKYEVKKSNAATNAAICYPYIRKSVIDSMLKGQEIGVDDKAKFRPENTTAKYKLQKDT